jgi:hypothetical protein
MIHLSLFGFFHITVPGYSNMPGIVLILAGQNEIGHVPDLFYF